MNVEEKERLIKKDIAMIENKVRHAFNQGYEMGVKAYMEQGGDAISRKYILDLIDTKGANFDDDLLIVEQWIQDAPSVNPHPIECGDAISRQAVLDAMYELCGTGETLKENPWRDNPHIDAITDAIENLPSVTPQQRTGAEVLDKIRAEIDRQEKWLLQAGYNAYNVDIAFDAIKSVVAESEVQE